MFEHKNNYIVRKNGNYFEFEEERNQDLMRVYRKEIAACEVIRINDIWKRMAEMPASRFWVSEERAAVVVAQIARGEKLLEMLPSKREMFHEIYNRVMAIRQHSPHLSIYRCCIHVVNSPAPKFYMTPLSIRETIYKIKRQWYRQRQQQKQ